MLVKILFRGGASAVSPLILNTDYIYSIRMKKAGKAGASELIIYAAHEGEKVSRIIIPFPTEEEVEKAFEEISQLVEAEINLLGPMLEAPAERYLRKSGKEEKEEGGQAWTPEGP